MTRRDRVLWERHGLMPTAELARRLRTMPHVIESYAAWGRIPVERIGRRNFYCITDVLNAIARKNARRDALRAASRVAGDAPAAEARNAPSGDDHAQ